MMNKRVLILVLALGLFGAAFGCNSPLSENASDYTLRFEFPKDKDVLIIETQVSGKLYPDEVVLDNGTYAYLLSDPATRFEDVQCTFLDDEDKARCTVTAAPGAIKRNDSIGVHIKARMCQLSDRLRRGAIEDGFIEAQLGDADLCENVERNFDIVQADLPVFDLSVVPHHFLTLIDARKSGNTQYYSFRIHVAMESNWRDLRIQEGLAPYASDEIAMERFLGDMRECSHLGDDVVECDFEANDIGASMYPIEGRFFRVIRDNDTVNNLNDDTEITPWIRMTNCVQGPGVALKPGADLCSVDSDRDGIPNDRDGYLVIPGTGVIIPGGYTLIDCAQFPNSPGCYYVFDCDLNPESALCPGSEAYCEEHTDDPECTDPVVDCDLNPEDPACTDPGVDCDLNPSDPSCPGNEEFCDDNPDDPSCPGSEAFCDDNPDDVSCSIVIPGPGPNGDDDDDDDGNPMSEGGGCGLSLVEATTANPFGLLFLIVAMTPMIYRKRR